MKVISAIYISKIWTVQASRKGATVVLEYGTAYICYGGTR
jgi:hypothetical protein